MAPGSPVRDSGASEPSSMLTTASQSAQSTAPTGYTLDLSVLASLPSDDSVEVGVSAAPRQASRNRSRGTSAPKPLPHARISEMLTDHDLDGPEDFTINMEYWMRCNLPEMQDLPPEVAPVADVTLDNSVGSWMSRGSERLIAMQRKRDNEADRDDAQAEVVPEPEAAKMETATLQELDTVRPGPEQQIIPVPDESQISRKLARLLGIEHLPSGPQLDRLISAREEKVRDLEERLELARKESSASESEFRKEKKRLMANTAQLREELVAHKAESEEQMEFLKREAEQSASDLNEAKLELATATNEADTVREELRLQQEKNSAEVSDLKSRLLKSQSFERQNLTADADFDALTTEIDELKQRGHKQQRNLLKLGQTTLEEIAKMQGNADRAISKLGRKLDQQRGLSSQLQDENEELEREVQELRERLRIVELDGTHEERGRSMDSARDRVRSGTDEVNKLRANLKLQMAEVEEARMDAQAARHEAAQLRADINSTNERLDARIAAEIRARDKEWAAKVTTLNNERRNLSRALMRTWGEAECGKEDPQTYRYRLVKGA